MAADRRPNKNSASEDELGKIHSMTTTLHSMRLEQMIMDIKERGIKEAEAIIGDGKALLAAGKWAADQNSVTASQPEMDADTELAQKLEKIRQAQPDKYQGNVVQFDDNEGEAMK